ncbi:MAG: hypothetical protein HY554_15910 [Elusimicrobia bacterium]|nr:hypothetical protein [Elusimicrobiota bacterium]
MIMPEESAEEGACPACGGPVAEQAGGRGECRECGEEVLAADGLRALAQRPAGPGR